MRCIDKCNMLLYCIHRKNFGDVFSLLANQGPVVLTYHRGCLITIYVPSNKTQSDEVPWETIYMLLFELYIYKMMYMQ